MGIPLILSSSLKQSLLSFYTEESCNKIEFVNIFNDSSIHLLNNLSNLINSCFWYLLFTISSFK